MQLPFRWALPLLLSTLAGCAGTVQTYSGNPKDASQIAVVRARASEFSGTGNRYFVSFASYAKLEPGQKPVPERVGNAFTGYPSELQLLPGRYAVMTRCSIMNQYAFPSFTLDAVAGATYEVICEPVADQLSRVRAIVEKVDTPSK